MTKRSIYRYIPLLPPVCRVRIKGDPRATLIACAMKSEYGYLPSAVYVRLDGTIHVNCDGWMGDYENLRDLACYASYEADQSGADKAECDSIFARFNNAWKKLEAL